MAKDDLAVWITARPEIGITEMVRRLNFCALAGDVITEVLIRTTTKGEIIVTLDD